MKKSIQLCQAVYRKVFDQTNDVTMIDVLLFTLGCGAAFPLPKSSFWMPMVMAIKNRPKAVN